MPRQPGNPGAVDARQTGQPDREYVSDHALGHQSGEPNYNAHIPVEPPMPVGYEQGSVVSARRDLGNLLPATTIRRNTSRTKRRCSIGGLAKKRRPASCR